MSVFIETIRLTAKGAENTRLHLERVHETAIHFFDTTTAMRLKTDFTHLLSTAHQQILENNTVYKLRIVYSNQIEQIEKNVYDERSIKSLKLVSSDFIDYKYKYANRADIEALHAQSGNCDDVIICLHGKLCDTSFCNLVFANENGLFTPDSCLLNGIRRRQLLQQGLIRQVPIHISDLSAYHSIFLINAMKIPAFTSGIPISSGVVF